VIEGIGMAVLAGALVGWMRFAAAEALLATARGVGRTEEPAGWLFYELHRYPRRLLIALALGRELALVTVAVLATLLGYGFRGLYGGAVALAVTVPVLLALRGVAAGRAARRVEQGGKGVGRALAWLLAPLMSLAAIEKSLGWRLARVFLGEAPRGDNIFAAEELAALSEEGAEELGAAERTLVAKAIAFGERSVRHVLTPRRDIVAVSADSPPAELLRVIHDSGCSRIPVYRGSKDDVVGILYVKDLIGQRLESGRIESLMRQPYVVPAEKSVGDLFREFRSRKVHIALVVDEYGSLVGLVTMEDLLEELFGEIRDEFDEDEPPAIRRRGPNTYEVNGRVPVRTLGVRLHLDLSPSGDEATIAGFVIERLGHVPAAGEQVQLEGCTMTVEKLDGPAIELLRVDLWP